MDRKDLALASWVKVPSKWPKLRNVRRGLWVGRPESSITVVPWLALAPALFARIKSIRVPVEVGFGKHVAAGMVSCCSHHLAWRSTIRFASTAAPSVSLDIGDVWKSPIINDGVLPASAISSSARAKSCSFWSYRFSSEAAPAWAYITKRFMVCRPGPTDSSRCIHLCVCQSHFCLCERWGASWALSPFLRRTPTPPCLTLKGLSFLLFFFRSIGQGAPQKACHPFRLRILRIDRWDASPNLVSVRPKISPPSARVASRFLKRLVTLERVQVVQSTEFWCAIGLGKAPAPPLGVNPLQASSSAVFSLWFSSCGGVVNGGFSLLGWGGVES